MHEYFSAPGQTTLLLPHPSKLPASANNPNTLGKLNIGQLYPPTGPNGAAAGWTADSTFRIAIRRPI